MISELHSTQTTITHKADDGALQAGPRYSYVAYGLRFESSLSLPELRSASHGNPDVTISCGDVPDTLPNPSSCGLAWQVAPAQLLLTVEDVARYLVVGNREIRILPFTGAKESDVRTFLLGSVLGALLHARQMLVLHASVISTKRGAVLFMGASGAGKSTLLGAFLKSGYAMLADDKAGIILDSDGVPQAIPGFPLVRLTAQAVRKLRYAVDGCEPQTSLAKYVLPVAQFHAEPIPLFAAYSLAAHNKTDIRLERLQTVDRFAILNRHTYRRRFLHQEEQRREHFRILGGTSRHARITRVLRPDHPFLIDELKERIEEDLTQ